MIIVYVSTAAIVACMIAAANSRRRQEEEEEKKKRAIKEGEVQVLLLNQNGEAMEIANNEKVLMIKVIEKDGNWFARLDGNSIDVEGRSFDECFQKIMDKFNPKGVQIVPFSVNRDCVDGYFVIIKVVNEEMIKKEEQLKEMADKMSATIKYEW